MRLFVRTRELASVEVLLGGSHATGLLDSLDSWALCVRRFQRELDEPADASDLFGADDYVGALVGRDRIASALAGIAAGRDEPPTLDVIDELFRTITVPDDTRLLP